jgi:DNA mismatch repair ATPase MutS
MPSPSLFYSGQLKEASLLLEKNRKNRVAIALLRLIAFAGALSCLYFSFQYLPPYPLAMMGVFIIIFIWLIRISADLSEKKRYLEKKVFVNTNELGMLENQDNEFDDGHRYITADGYCSDLDIFGHASLFHLINRTTTPQGSEQLANLMVHPQLDPIQTIQMQEATRQLSAQPTVMQNVLVRGLMHEEKEDRRHDITNWLQMRPLVSGAKWIKPVRVILPVLNIAALLYYLSTDNYLFLIVTVFASWLMISRFSKYIQEQHTLVSKKQAVLEQYASILKAFHAVKAGNSQLLASLLRTAQQADAAILKLSKLSSMFDQRLNLVVNILLNSFFLYDIQCVLALEQWKHRHHADYGDWIQAMGKIETINSLAVFAYNHPKYCYPVLNERISLQTTGLGHPLIAENEMIRNDISIGEKEKVLVITGSNMSGKTTFLRSIGVNLLLAQCGAPVCASSFVFSPMQILTSIRITDSLQEHTSYFMAELKRLQSIVRQMENGVKSLVLIDEILRGTNSDDKTNGSANFIIRLLSYNCVALFATHDLALSHLEDEYGEEISNYCFESIIQDGELIFDYKLKNGVAKNKNASFLMQKMGII